MQFAAGGSRVGFTVAAQAAKACPGEKTNGTPGQLGQDGMEDGMGWDVVGHSGMGHDGTPCYAGAARTHRAL